MRPYSLLLVSALSLGCAVDSTEPRALTLQPHFSIDAAAAAFPNVARFRNEFVFLIQDQEADLFAIAGLPDHPKEIIECGGTEPLHFAIADVQWIGFRQDVIKALAKGVDYNLDLYRNSTFQGVCASDPIAHGSGSGRVRFNENDVFRTSGRTDTYAFWMEGPVTFTDGGTAHLLGHAVAQITPESGGVPRFVVSNISLSGR